MYFPLKTSTMQSCFQLQSDIALFKIFVLMESPSSLFPENDFLVFSETEKRQFLLFESLSLLSLYFPIFFPRPPPWPFHSLFPDVVTIAIFSQNQRLWQTTTRNVCVFKKMLLL